MKLIRLATDDNGIFHSNFQNDMIIAPQSQMALLNLTFQTNIGTFAIVPGTATLKVKTDTAVANSEQTVTIPGRSYSVAEKDTFYRDIQHALNSALQNVNARGVGSTAYNGICSAFRIGETESGVKTLEYRYAPFINPVRSFDTLPYQQMIWSSDITEITLTSDLATRKTKYNKDAGESATADRTNKVLPLNGRRLNDGSALFSARVADFVDNGGGVGNQNNGFGIGLSKRNLGVDFDATADIPADDRDFEIRFNRVTENYVYIDNGGLEIDSGVIPLNVTGSDQVSNDLLFMEVSGNVLQLGVYQDDGTANGARTVFTSYSVQAGEELYPYLYIRGAKNTIAVEAFNFSVDPWLPSIGGDEDGNNDNQLVPADDSALSNDYFDIMDSSNFANSITKIADQRYDEDLKFNVLMNPVVWRALGFTQFQGETNAGFINNPLNSRNIFWSVKIARTLPVEYSSDNFIVESMSLPLDSFDASKVSYTGNILYNNVANDKLGRRKNILMTIPVNDNSSGVVEYEASTPIFIDINNAEEINAKNLNLRILRKDFSPIVQGEQTAIMTILIKNPNE